MRPATWWRPDRRRRLLGVEQQVRAAWRRGGQNVAVADARIESRSRRWVPRRVTPSVFGIVPEGARRRRPSDVARIAFAVLVVLLTALGVDELTGVEHAVFDLLASLPSWLRDTGQVVYRAAAGGTAVVVVGALLVTRRWRLVATVVVAGVLGALGALGLHELVDAESTRTAAGIALDDIVPEYPAVVLATCTAILTVATPYMLRPARRTVVALLWIGSLGALFALVGLPDDLVAGFAVGWAAAAAVHLVRGTPAATPTVREVERALDALGVGATRIQLRPDQAWGITRFEAVAPEGAALLVEVIGRDTTDAQLLAKLWRTVWFKDSGPGFALTRRQQLEHEAYVLLLAARAGVTTSEVILAGVGGPKDTAVLVLREPVGTALTDLAPAQVTDSVLDDAWRALGLLHDARISHGRMGAGNVLLRGDGTTAIIDFSHAAPLATADHCALDDVGLLVTTADLVGTERALAAARRALGDDGLSDLLPLLEPAAISGVARHDLADKHIVASLREQGAELVGAETVQLVKLRRVSWGEVFLAVATIFGLYLLIGELSQVDYSTIVDTAEWGWVAIAFLIAPTPKFTGAIALQGAVAAPLPTGAVVAEQFAKDFTGLIGGTIATTALVVRFFQRQGMKVAVAASSGVLDSLAGFLVQIVLVVIGLLATSSDFNFSRAGGRDIAGIAIVIVVVAALAISVVLFVPRLRRWSRSVVASQWEAARDNLKGIVATPRNALMIFGGNVGSQILFALAMDATLRAFGQSLPLLQVIVINNFATLIGGAVPIPGGMGVMEAGLIAGFTAAGVPQSEAVAATFTYRTLTAYLPPVWGWFAMRWLRHRDYL